MSEVRVKSDQDIWNEIYGSTPATIAVIARLLNLSKRKVTRVIELAHSIPPPADAEAAR